MSKKTRIKNSKILHVCTLVVLILTVFYMGVMWSNTTCYIQNEEQELEAGKWKYYGHYATFDNRTEVVTTGLDDMAFEDIRFKLQKGDVLNVKTPWWGQSCSGYLDLVLRVVSGDKIEEGMDVLVINSWLDSEDVIYFDNSFNESEGGAGEYALGISVHLWDNIPCCVISVCKVLGDEEDCISYYFKKQGTLWVLSVTPEQCDEFTGTDILDNGQLVFCSWEFNIELLKEMCLCSPMEFMEA